MRIGFIGIGHIGGLCARLLAADGHDVMLSFSRDPERLRAFATELKGNAGTPVEAIAFADVIVISIPWNAFPELLAQVHDFQNKIVIDTSNAYGSIDLPPNGMTAASFNAARLPHTRYTKSFNTLTSAFQAESAGWHNDERVVQWLCGDDGEAKRTVATLIEGIGFAAVDVGSNAQAAVMESPRRTGSVYGEEYRLPDALKAIAAVREGRSLPATPRYR